MSRLDYITIAIVAACILAIIFLVYKMTDLFGDEPVVDPIETTTTPVEVEDSTYQYNIDDAGTDTGEADTDADPSTAAADPSDAEDGFSSDDSQEDEEASTPTTAQRPTSYSSGKFLVIAGTFSKSALAKNHAAKLRGMGFSNARVEPFDRGKYDVVLVDRFDNMASAERLVKDLKAKGVASYVKAKEAQ